MLKVEQLSFLRLSRRDLKNQINKSLHCLYHTFIQGFKKFLRDRYKTKIEGQLERKEKNFF